MIDHRRGALIGLAVGDALGAAVEFRSPGSFAPVTGYRSGGPHGLKAGEWTDDTSMALALADSIATVGWDLNDQADRYVQWLQTGKYSVISDVASTSVSPPELRSAITSPEKTRQPNLWVVRRAVGYFARGRTMGWLRIELTEEVQRTA